MPKWAKGAAGATLLTASFVALGAGPVLARVTGGMPGGRQVTPAHRPAPARGGAARPAAPSAGTPARRADGDRDARPASGDHGLRGGDDLDGPIGAPVHLCGTSSADLGRAVAGCRGGADVEHAGRDERKGSGRGGERDGGGRDAPGGARVGVPAGLPVHACAAAGCAGRAYTALPGTPGGDRATGSVSAVGGVFGGDPGNRPAAVPAKLCGNPAAVLGDAAAGCAGVIWPAQFGGRGGRAPGRYGSGGDHATSLAAAPPGDCGSAGEAAPRPKAACDDHCVYPSRPRVFRALSELPQLPAGALPPGAEAVQANPAAMPALPTLRLRTFWHVHRAAGLGLPQASTPVRPPAKAPSGQPGAHRPGSVPSTGAGAPSSPAGSSAKGVPAAPGSAAGDARDGAAAGDPAWTAPHRGSATLAGRLPGRLPGALPELPRRLMFAAPWRLHAHPLTRSLPGLPSVPVVRPVPQAGTVIPVAPHGAHLPPPVGGPPKQIPPMRDVAAQPRSDAEHGALFAMALAGLLAASSGAISMVRRLRER